jgi:hypothetical protein
VQRLERIHGLRGARFLSETALRRFAFLDVDTSKKISQEYQTWDEFVQAAPEQVARQFGTSPAMVQGWQAGLAARRTAFLNC